MGDTGAKEIEEKVLKLEELVENADLDIGHSKKHLLLRAKNLAATLLDPYVLFHTRIVVSLVKKRGGDIIDEITAWLHDIGRAVTGKGHREVGAIWAGGWLKKFYITDDEIHRILDGIRNHGTRDRPETKTGKLLRLADALAAFDPGWATMIVEYHRKWESSEKGEKELLKKRAVIEEMGTEEDKECVRKALEVLGIKPSGK